MKSFNFWKDEVEQFVSKFRDQRVDFPMSDEIVQFLFVLIKGERLIGFYFCK